MAVNSVNNCVRSHGNKSKLLFPTQLYWSAGSVDAQWSDFLFKRLVNLYGISFQTIIFAFYCKSDMVQYLLSCRKLPLGHPPSSTVQGMISGKPHSLSWTVMGKTSLYYFRDLLAQKKRPTKAFSYYWRFASSILNSTKCIYYAH